MEKNHQYALTVEWTGNKGEGTYSYTAYERSHIIKAENKVDILCSSDPAFRGDKAKHNPEELFLASISSCHMLWFLHLCSSMDIVVTHYTDHAKGIMIEAADGGGHFKQVILYPKVTIKDQSQIEMANKLHEKAHKFCFIANSCNFPIHHQPTCISLP